MKRLANYSQYFLRSPQLIKVLIGHSTLKKSDTVYDIGAGSGVITSVLAERVQSVVAIEFEPRIAQTLRQNMRDFDNVTVVEGDFLEMEMPKKSFKIFANIPFHLSSPIVRKITESPNPPTATYLIVQKQFANKLLPTSDRFTGQLGMLIGPQFAVRVRKTLNRKDFWPHPNVDTVLLEILLRPDALIDPAKMPAYRRFIVDCFSDPKVFKKMPIAATGLKADVRPSQMKLPNWIKLFNAQNIYK